MVFEISCEKKQTNKQTDKQTEVKHSRAAAVGLGKHIDGLIWERSDCQAEDSPTNIYPAF